MNYSHKREIKLKHFFEFLKENRKINRDPCYSDRLKSISKDYIFEYNGRITFDQLAAEFFAFFWDDYLNKFRLTSDETFYKYLNIDFSNVIINSILEDIDKLKSEFKNYLLHDYFNFNNNEKEKIEELKIYMEKFTLNKKQISIEANNISEILFDLFINILKKGLTSKYKRKKKNFNYEITLYSGKQSSEIQKYFPAENYYYINLFYNFEFSKPVQINSRDGFYSKIALFVNNLKKVQEEIALLRRNYIFIEDIYLKDSDALEKDKINLIGKIFPFEVELDNKKIELEYVKICDKYIIIKFFTDDIESFKKFSISCMIPRYNKGERNFYPIIVSHDSGDYNLTINYNKYQFNVKHDNNEGVNIIEHGATIRSNLNLKNIKISFSDDEGVKTRQTRERCVEISPI